RQLRHGNSTGTPARLPGKPDPSSPHLTAGSTPYRYSFVPLPLIGRLVKLMNMISMFARNSACSVTHLRIAALLIGLLLLPAFAVGQTFVQVNSNPTAQNAASVTVSYATPETAGHLNVVVVGWTDTTSSVTSV